MLVENAVEAVRLSPSDCLEHPFELIRSDAAIVVLVPPVCFTHRVLPKRVMVCGGRHYADREFVRSAIDRHTSPVDELVCGGCSGADELCAAYALSRGMKVEVHRADWDRYGRAAGPIRNRGMARSDIDLCIAFPGRRGTRNAVDECIDAGVDVVRYV